MTKEAPVDAEYAGRQFVGIDLHRRRSVLVRMSEAGQRLDVVRIDNDPVALGLEIAKAGPDPEVVLEATYGWVRREGAWVQVGGTAGGSADVDVEGVVPGPVRIGPSPPGRASRVTAGCEARGRSRRGSCSIRGHRARRRPAGSRGLPGPGWHPAVPG